MPHAYADTTMLRLCENPAFLKGVHKGIINSVPLVHRMCASRGMNFSIERFDPSENYPLLSYQARGELAELLDKPMKNVRWTSDLHRRVLSQDLGRLDEIMERINFHSSIKREVEKEHTGWVKYSFTAGVYDSDHPEWFNGKDFVRVHVMLHAYRACVVGDILDARPCWARRGLADIERLPGFSSIVI